jgi:two-component system, LuxR family, response regulator FixJ
MQDVQEPPSHNVFVIDDDPSVRKALHRLFRSSGFSVETFDSATAFLASETPKAGGCLVVDIHMPGMNGFEFRKKLLSLGVDLPTVFITGQDTENTRTVADQCKAAAYFAKPFDSDQLLQSVRGALNSVAKPARGDLE